MKYLKSQRKVLIFAASVVIAIASTFFMELGYYEKFLTFVATLAIGFFAGNSLEHISSAIGKRE